MSEPGFNELNRLQDIDLQSCNPENLFNPSSDILKTGVQYFIDPFSPAFTHTPAGLNH